MRPIRYGQHKQESSTAVLQRMCAYPFREEGEPGGPDLPEDLTQIQQQINRIYQHPDAMQSIPEHDALEPVNPNQPLPLSPETRPTEVPEHDRRDSSASESIPQPDQEPDTQSRQETQSPDAASIDIPTDQAEGFITCADEECALVSTTVDHLACDVSSN